MLIGEIVDTMLNVTTFAFIAAMGWLLARS